MKCLIAAVSFVVLASILAPGNAYPTGSEGFREEMKNVALDLINDDAGAAIEVARIVVGKAAISDRDLNTWRSFIIKWDGVRIGDIEKIEDFQYDLDRLGINETKDKQDAATKRRIDEITLSFGERSLRKIDKIIERFREEANTTTNRAQKNRLNLQISVFTSQYRNLSSTLDDVRNELK